MLPAQSLGWTYSDSGRRILVYLDREVGSVWEPKGKAQAAWKAGHQELGVPETGPKEEASLDEAESACQLWVMTKTAPRPDESA